MLLTSCMVGQGGESFEPFKSATSESMSSTVPVLFIETERTGSGKDDSHVSRSRFVEVDFSVLFDEMEGVSNLNVNSQVTLNLFPDVTYIGIIDQVEQSGDGYSWVGHLKDVDLSSLTMIYTSGVFIAKFASPEGVYEVSVAGDDLYQVVLIDQTTFPGGE